MVIWILYFVAWAVFSYISAYVFLKYTPSLIDEDTEHRQPERWEYLAATAVGMAASLVWPFYLIAVPVFGAFYWLLRKTFRP